MSLKKVLTFALALFITGGGLQAQKLIVGADFTTRFDNREYANNDFNESQTLFSARLTPRIGVEWMDKNRLIVGVDLLQNFGDDTKFLSKARPLAYYQFNSRNVQANAGIFDRKELLGDYSLAFFGDSTAFYHNRLSGFLGHYKSTERRNTYVEMAIDWEGMYSEESREMFRIISAGRYTLDKGFYFGYAFSMFHFAGKIGNENVTDNLLVNPYAGWEFNAYFDFDIKAGFLFAPQRARSIESGWKKQTCSRSGTPTSESRSMPANSSTRPPTISTTARGSVTTAGSSRERWASRRAWSSITTAQAWARSRWSSSR